MALAVRTPERLDDPDDCTCRLIQLIASVFFAIHVQIRVQIRVQIHVQIRACARAQTSGRLTASTYPERKSLEPLQTGRRRRNGEYVADSAPDARPVLAAVFGPRLRLAAELNDGVALDKQRRAAGTTTRDEAPKTEDEQDPHDADGLSQRLHLLARPADCDLADQLSLLLQFDALEGWRAAG